MITVQGKIIFEDNNVFVFDKKNLISLTFDILDRADVKMPNWGIISNSGSMTLIDRKGEIKELAKSKKLKGNITIDFYLTNTLAKSTQNVGSFFAQKWDYDSENKTVSINFGDELTQWQNIQIVPLEVNLTKSKVYYETALSLLDGIATKANIQFEIDEITISHLQGILVPLPNYSGSVWSVLEDFAIAFQLRIYKNYLGQIVCKYDGEQ